MIPITPRAALLARVYIGITVPLLALTLVAFIARVRIRVSPSWRVRLDDWLITFGFVCQFSSSCFRGPSNLQFRPAPSPTGGCYVSA